MSLALRVLVLIASLMITGFGPAFAEIAGCTDAVAGECCTDCPFEKASDECPPGCPNCHCSHGSIAIAPRVESVVALRFAASGEPPSVPYEARVPRAPPLPGVYRPPRLLAALS